MMRQASRIYFRVLTAAAKTGLTNLAPGGVPFDTWNAHTWYWK